MARDVSSRLKHAVVALGLAAVLAPAAAQADQQPVPPMLKPRLGHGSPLRGHGEQGLDRGRGHFKAVCEDRGGHCTARVVTDANGVPVVSAHPTAASGGPADLAANVAYSPANLHSAYRLPWSSPVRQTIAVIDSYDHPNVKADLDTFDSAWGLGYFPSCSATVTTGCFQRVDQNGNERGFANDDPAMAKAWDIETNLDVQYAHATCLNCKILLVEAFRDTPGGDGLAAANNTAARLGATEISNSWGYLEGTFGTWNPTAFNHPGIAITASAHDHGYGAYYPADLNTVVAVGGTNLTINSDGSYNSEVVWGNGTVAPDGWGTGSGCSTFNSTYTAAATWQKAVPNWYYTGCGNARSIADVSAVGDPNTGAWVYNSVPNTNGQTGWFKIGGTSLTAPIIAGAFALAGNAGSYSWPAQMMYQRTNQFHDVTRGSNGSCTWTIMCNAWTGYDGPTGVGSPWGIGGV
jgi:subtilase family serine protease